MNYQDLKYIVKTGGYKLIEEIDSEAPQYFQVKDAIEAQDATKLLKRVYTEVIQESVEMQMVGERLVRTMRFDSNIGSGTEYTWVGPGNIPDPTRIGTQEYPEFSIAVGTGTEIKAQFKNYGYVVKISDEQIRYSQWDVITQHIMEAGKALARFKEKTIFQLFNNTGVVVFDNNIAMPSIKGKCTGRDRYGVANGAITQEDLFDMYCQGLANGYNPNVILVHPLAYPIFQKDPILRNAGYNMYNPREFINSSLNPVNSYKNSTIDTWRQQQRRATGNSQTLNENEISLTSTGFSQMPSYSPLSGISIVVSHMVALNPVDQTTSIFMIDTAATGIINVREPIRVDEWREESREITAVRIKESYSIDVIDSGRGIMVAKNVPLVPNEIFNNPQVVLNDLTP